MTGWPKRSCATGMARKIEKPEPEPKRKSAQSKAEYK